jgi:TonB family protein
LRSEHARLLVLANQRIAQGRLVEPEADSAHHYLDLLLAADPAFAGVAETAQLLGERLIETAQRLAAGDRQRESERMLAVAGIVGVPAADIEAARGAIAARRAPVERRVLPESALVRTRSVAAAYPARAAAQGVEGWVEVEFTVGTDGRTRDALVTGSSPPGVFDQAATAAIARWRYQPQLVNGQAVDQRVAARLRFSLDDR